MATISSASFPAPAHAAPDWQNRLAELRTFWRQFVAKAFNPYRPELHYMRGPGPAWRAKHLGRSELSFPVFRGLPPAFLESAWRVPDCAQPWRSSLTAIPRVILATNGPPP